nr:EamA family transporter [Paraburkholderia guartelaensis]
MSSVQFSAALAAPAMSVYGVFNVTELRLAWAALVLALVIRPRFREYGGAHWLAAGSLGISMAGMTIGFFCAIERVPLGLAVAIEFLGPLAVAVWGARRRSALVWPVVAIAGVLLLARDDTGWVGEPLGVLFAICAAIGWASYIVLMKRTGTMFDGLEGLSVSLIAATLAALPFTALNVDMPIDLHAFVTTAGLAILAPLIPYALEMTALRQMSASSFGVFMSIEPAVAALAGFVVLHERLGTLQLAGVLLVVSASIGEVVTGRSQAATR